jgi:surfeit locus 1 family protein
MTRLFRPSLALTLAVLVLLPTFLFLGWWQLQRAEEKRQLQAQYDALARDEPVWVSRHAESAEALRFRRVRARGVYEPRYQILLDNRVHQGQAGYHVLTPLRLEASDMRVLVNRGWVPLGESRDRPPALETPGGVVEVVGVATLPSEVPLKLVAPPGAGSWQPVWPYLDIASYRAATGFPVQPVVVLLDPQSPAGGFGRYWTRLDAGIAVHHGYAFQWFALALALVAIYVYLGVRAGRATTPSEDQEAA